MKAGENKILIEQPYTGSFQSWGISFIPVKNRENAGLPIQAIPSRPGLQSKIPFFAEMKEKRLLPLLAVLLAIPFTAAAQRPNVILILMDDMGWGDLPSYQDQRMKEGLPAMDNPGLRTLASEGMTLTRHYSSAPLCAPARSSLFTGVHQGHAKVIRDRSFDLPIEQAPTLGTVMQSAGYRTALIGKWGIGGGTEHAGTPQESTAYPTKRGFDYYFGYLDHVSGHHHYPKEDPNPISPTKRSGIWDGDKCVTADCDKAYSVDLLTARAKNGL